MPSKWALLRDYVQSRPFSRNKSSDRPSLLPLLPLLALPDVILFIIIETIGSPADLLSFARTCRKLCLLVEAQLYRVITIRWGRQALNLHSTLRTYPARFEHVRDFRALPQGFDWRGVEGVPDMVEKMRRLGTLRVQTATTSPHIEALWVKEFMRMFGSANDGTIVDAPLRNLTSFTFHGRAPSDYCSISIYLPVITSRTLQHLHLSCVKIAEFNVSPTLTKSTPLQTLILDECVIEPGPLTKLLSLPRALAYLSLRERVMHANDGSDLNRDPVAFLSALQQQNESLKYLQHVCPGFTQHRPYTPEKIAQANRDLRALGSALDPTSGFSSFDQLKVLELDWISILTQLLNFPHLAPPCLHTYRLTSLAHIYDENWEHLARRLFAVPHATRFKHLSLHMLPDPAQLRNTNPKSISIPPNQSRLITFITIAKYMKQNDITTSVSLCSYDWRYEDGVTVIDREGGRVVKPIFDSETFWDRGEEEGVVDWEDVDEDEYSEDWEDVDEDEYSGDEDDEEEEDDANMAGKGSTREMDGAGEAHMDGEGLMEQ